MVSVAGERRLAVNGKKNLTVVGNDSPRELFAIKYKRFVNTKYNLLINQITTEVKN